MSAGFRRGAALYAVMAVLFVLVGQMQSWNLSLTILNLCLISTVMALGVNNQWGYAGLFNVGIMGFAALGGLAAVLTSMPPVAGAISAGGFGMALAILALVVAVAEFGVEAKKRYDWKKRKTRHHDEGGGFENDPDLMWYASQK